MSFRMQPEDFVMTYKFLMFVLNRQRAMVLSNSLTDERLRPHKTALQRQIFIRSVTTRGRRL